jgi:hypothetical protein
MSVDLKSITLFKRSSLLLMDDCLIMLDHEHTRDRVRRIMFDRVENVVIWRRIPWGRIIFLLIVLGLPAFGVVLMEKDTGRIIGECLLALVAAVIAWYLYCRHTTIYITRGGQTHMVGGIFRPGRVRRFRDRLIDGIRNTQATLANRSV